MGTYLKTSSMTIKSDAEKIKELTDSIPQLVNDLSEALNRLNGCWVGPAWNQYQNTNAYYMEVLQDVYSYYVNYTANMQQAAQEYMRAEQDVMDQVDSWLL